MDINTKQLATTVMINYLKSEGINITFKEAKVLIDKWATRLPKIDSLSLAAVAISDPYESALTASEIREIRKFYFPSKH